MRKFFPENFKVVVFLLIGFLILWWVTKGQDLTQIWAEFIDAKYIWIILAMGISIISHFIRTLRWKILINHLGYNPPVSRVFYSLMTGYLANLVLPRVGEITRCVALKKTDKIPFNELLGTVISERVFDTICVLALLFALIAIQFDLLKGYVKKFLYTPFASMVESNLILLIIIVLGGVVLLIVALLLLRRKLKSKNPGNIINKGKEQIIGLKSGLLSIFKIKQKGLFLFYTFILWSLYLFMVYVSFLAISSTAHLGFFAALSVLVLGSIGVAMPVPAGIGTYHFAVITCLTELFAINAEPATSYAYINHASQIVVMTLLGGFAWFKLAMNKNLISYENSLNG